ncbi:MAG: ImmA/IrrE family metallo-endopeptidase [Rikenellaceae bacterium]|nr:ImmA/IrrE family metallo-endopeptidase [Rikenellaceae bacterium]
MTQPSTKTKFRRGFKKWTDDKVIEIREQLGLKSFSPLCAYELCKFLKVPIYTPKEVNGLLDNHIKALTDDSSTSSWSAVTIRIGVCEHLIIHNPTHSPARQQSNIMHELGHIICGHTLSTSNDCPCFAGGLRDIDGEKESEAEWFDACMQLPRPALIHCLRKGMSSY